MFTLRFDMRLRDGFASAPELYRAALEMAAWGEQHGAAIAMVSEHHAASDGYLPAPLVLASAMAARTTKLPIQIAALLVPLHDPIELAEQMAVLDIVSGGRVSYICALGYRPEEYAMFGRDIRQRGKRMERHTSNNNQTIRASTYHKRTRSEIKAVFIPDKRPWKVCRMALPLAMYEFFTWKSGKYTLFVKKIKAQQG